MFLTTILYTILPIVMVNQCLAFPKTNTSFTHTRQDYEHVLGIEYGIEEGKDGRKYHSFNTKAKFFQAASYAFIEGHRLPLSDDDEDMDMVCKFIQKQESASVAWVIKRDDTDSCFVVINDGDDYRVFPKDCGSENYVVTVEEDDDCVVDVDLCFPRRPA
ncbi:unnamed protein product [Orchesella dallaii]|uniref:Uncharacterized protein n=1 Tax=Orchesella dallaii TaxID=48710 RepID=A0ABP1QGJ8_9HEXA